MTKGFAVASLLLLSLSAAPARAQMGVAQGRIVDEVGAPVVGATVQFDFQSGMSRQYTVETDAEGEYQQIVTAGRYRITASKEGYQGGFMEQTVNAGGPTPLPDVELVSRESLMQAALAPIMEKFQKAGELTRAGKLDEAVAVFQELAAENPDIPEVHFNLGTIYARQEKWAEAEAAFQKTLELQPENTQAAQSLSGVYESLERPDDAIAVMEKLATAHPDDARVQYNLGILYTNQRRVDEAYATLQQAERLDPDNVEVHYVLGTLALNQGQSEAAVAHLETYVQEAAEDAPYRATASELLENLKQALGQAQPRP
jgi:Flp pilus assembly protein TadD